MLEQFVAKLDDTCHRLHARMLRDESPYVATTSRLEHLSQATRELVEQIARVVGTADSTVFRDELRADAPPFAIDVLPHRRLTEESLEKTILPTLLPQLANTAMELPRLSQSMSISESLPIPDRAEPIEVKMKSRRILILEESPFYRHLIGIAVQSAGYEPHSVESDTQALAALEQSTDFCAILRGAFVSSALEEGIRHHRQTNRVKVIGLTMSGHEISAAIEVDELVSKSHPQQLIGVLERLLKNSSGEMRMSA